MSVSRPSPTEDAPFDLSKTPIHFDGQNAWPVGDFTFDGASFQAYIEAFCAEGAPGRIIMVELTPTDWPAWECHTQGDEIVIVLEGRGEFIHEISGEERRMPFGPGCTFINPGGVWHTADVTEPMRAIYITPAPGTEHRPR